MLWVAHTGLTLCMYVLSSLVSSSRLFHLDRYSLWNSIFPSVACLLVSGSRDSLGHNKFPFVFCKSFQFWPDCGDYHRTNSMKYARICIEPEADVLLSNTYFTERWTSFHAILTCFLTLYLIIMSPLHSAFQSPCHSQCCQKMLYFNWNSVKKFLIFALRKKKNCTGVCQVGWSFNKSSNGKVHA